LIRAGAVRQRDVISFYTILLILLGMVGKKIHWLLITYH